LLGQRHRGDLLRDAQGAVGRPRALSDAGSSQRDRAGAVPASQDWSHRDCPLGARTPGASPLAGGRASGVSMRRRRGI